MQGRSITWKIESRKELFNSQRRISSSFRFEVMKLNKDSRIIFKVLPLEEAIVWYEEQVKEKLERKLQSKQFQEIKLTRPEFEEKSLYCKGLIQIDLSRYWNHITQERFKILTHEISVWACFCASRPFFQSAHLNQKKSSQSLLYQNGLQVDPSFKNLLIMKIIARPMLCFISIR